MGLGAGLTEGGQRAGPNLPHPSAAARRAVGGLLFPPRDGLSLPGKGRAPPRGEELPPRNLHPCSHVGGVSTHKLPHTQRGPHPEWEQRSEPGHGARSESEKHFHPSQGGGLRAPWVPSLKLAQCEEGFAAAPPPSSPYHARRAQDALAGTQGFGNGPPPVPPRGGFCAELPFSGPAASIPCGAHRYESNKPGLMASTLVTAERRPYHSIT